MTTDVVREVRLEPLDQRWRSDVADVAADPEEGFAAVDRDGRFVGLGLAPQIDRAAGEVELGYIVASAARGQGVGTQILSLLTEWAFREVQAQRIFLIIDVENRASGRVAERCGYRREGVMRSLHAKPGRRVDAALWSRLPSDPEPPARA